MLSKSLVALLSLATCARAASGPPSALVVERDMPQSRNLVPVLTRTTLVAAVATEPLTFTITQLVPAARWRPGPFWPTFGEQALMGVPMVVPGGVVVGPPTHLGAPAIEVATAETRLVWPDIALAPGAAAAVHSNTWLGPADLYHSADGMRFGSLDLALDFAVDRGLRTRLTLVNRGAGVIRDLELSWFLPRALLDEATGAEAPLVSDARVSARGLGGDAPLDLLVCDGLARPALGWRSVVKLDSLPPATPVTFEVAMTGTPVATGVILPVLSLMARADERYWPSSEITITPPCDVRYADYTQFNVVVAASRMFVLSPAGATVERSSDLVRTTLETPAVAR